MQPRDDQVLVVARVADDRRAVRAARQVLEEAAALELELDVVGRVVELLLGHRARRRRPSPGPATACGSCARPAGRSAARAGSRRRRSCRGRGTGRRTSSPRCGWGCWGCWRSATGRRSAAWARPRAGRWRRAGRRACPARAAPPRPSGSARANGGSRKIRPKCSGARNPCPRAAGGRAGVAAAPPGLSAAAPALAPIAPRNRLRLSRCPSRVVMALSSLRRGSRSAASPG